MIMQSFHFVAVLIVIVSVSLPSLSQDRLINMVPNSRSGEINQDAEPTITVDPNNGQYLAGSAFTWDNLTGSPMVTDTAPVYVSSNGGNTWTLAFIVPSKVGSTYPTADITLSFSSTPGGGSGRQTSWLYGGILSSAATGRPMTALRAQDLLSATSMTVLDIRTGNVDQPHTLSQTSGGEDKLYLGFNNGFSCTAPNGRSATLDVSQDAKVAAPSFVLDVIEARNTTCQDGFAQVPAVHKDGTIYAAFIHDYNGGSRLTVVRDDNWGVGAAPFSALRDPSDNLPGRFVTPVLSLPIGTMGQNRLGASNVSIAVDPNNSDRVYVAWGDSYGFINNNEIIHVRRSINRGLDWSEDLFRWINAINPEIAINDFGIVGVLYQPLISGKWETRLVLSKDLDATTFPLPGILLARQDALNPPAIYSPYIGDYASLIAVGSSFIGMFSASNYPDRANFFPGVAYQREVDWTAHKLYADASHTIEVPPSIDPFFFEIRTTVCNRSNNFCKICAEAACFPFYDPWWWLKCPACEITIYINPRDEFERIAVFDSLGRQVGRFEKLAKPLVEKGVTYTYAVELKIDKGVGYVARAESANQKVQKSFIPAYMVKLQDRSQVPQ